MPEWYHLRRFFHHFSVDCVFDVGANRGQYARMLRSKVGFQGDIISFEPVPELVNELEQISASDPHWHVAGIPLDHLGVIDRRRFHHLGIVCGWRLDSR